MTIQTSCPHCQQPYTLADSQEGKQVRCRSCSHTFHVPSLAPLPHRRPERDEDRPPLRKRGRSRKGLTIALVCGFVGAAVLIGGGVLIYHAWNRGVIGCSGSPDKDIVGRWVDTEKTTKTICEFRRDGTFLRESNNGFADALLPGSGTYKFLEENLVEIRPTPQYGISLPPWVVEVYVGPEELRVFVGGRVTQDIRKPWTDGYMTFLMRREGKIGPIPTGKGIGGSAEKLRERVRGRWRYNHECWAFTADDKLLRSYHSITAACKYVDGHTIELTDKGGKHVLKVYHHKDTLRMMHYLVLSTGKQVHYAMFTAPRIPDEDHDDDPLPGDPKALIVGEWQYQRPSGTTDDGRPNPTFHFDRNGRYTGIDRGGRHVNGSYRILPDNRLELTEAPFLPHPVFAENIKPKVCRVIFTKKKMGLNYLDWSWMDEGEGKLRYNEVPEIYRRVAAGGK